MVVACRTPPPSRRSRSAGPAGLGEPRHSPADMYRATLLVRNAQPPRFTISPQAQGYGRVLRGGASYEPDIPVQDAPPQEKVKERRPSGAG